MILRIVRFTIMFLWIIISKAFLFSLLCVSLNAQSINIGNFYYRDFLDFGQNKGIFKEGAEQNGGVAITGKDGTQVSVPNVPNFSASSNNGNLTAVGRGFVVTANHVTSPENPSSSPNLRKWGLTEYTISSESATSQGYGRDEKFFRFDKYIVEGQSQMLNVENSLNSANPTKEQENIQNFKNELTNFKDDKGNIYLYQAGSGVITLRGNTNTNIDRIENGETKGGGFGTLGQDSIKYECLVQSQSCDSRGIMFNYNPNLDSGFNNRITSGDSGSGIYAYDTKKNEWVLLGVTSQEWSGQNRAFVSLVSNKDFESYQSKFEQKINLKIQDPAVANIWTLNSNNLKFEPRGDTPNKSHILETNKDIIFRGGGTIKVQGSIYRNVSGQAGGFVFEKADTETTYKFTNEQGKNYFFKGSGLDIGEKVKVEWELHNQSGDSLHKIGKGELIVKTNYTPTSTSENLGTLKIGEGKVTLDTTTKAFDNIYITSGRGELALTQGKATALGATSANSYTLAQDSTDKMGFYFGKGGGVLDLGGNSLKLNTIAANDKNAIITNSSTSTQSTLEIQGLGYGANNQKTSTKADTIIHASFGETPTAQNSNGTAANLNLIYNGDKTAVNSHSERSEESISTNSVDSSATLSPQNDKAGASLIFDGNINTSGKMEVTNGNIALQGHATTHATISSESIRNQITNAENGTQKPMPDYMDLSKPSTLNQPDWDDRIFKIAQGITLTDSTLTLGRNATLESDITASNNSTIRFGGNVKHFIDNKDGKNVTGSGFSYQQLVESDALSEDMQKIANETIHYKGKITATGGTIESHILDFNASLDLKSGATLTADYLTIETSNTIKLENGTSASVKTLKLQSISDSDLSTIFANNSANSTKLSVTEALWFNSVGSFDLTKLDSANVEIKPNYDIRGVKSTITGTSKDLIANVSLFEEANLTLKSLTLKDTKANEVTTNGTTNTLKNSVYLQGDSKQTSNTKLTLTDSLKADGVEKATIQLWGKSEIIAPKITFNNVKDGILALDKDSKLTSANGNANVEVSGVDSSLKIGILGDKNFDINAQGGSKITLGLLESRDKTQTPSANFSGKITAKDSSVVATALESITASVDLSGSAKLNAIDIVLQNSHNSIKLSDTATLTAQTITAKSVANLTLQQNGGTANIGKFIFDGGTTNLTGNLIGNNIELKNSTIKTTDLTFNNKQNTTLELDKDSKLDITNLKVENANLTLNLADSSKNTASLQKITLNNNANLNINSWDFGNTTAFSSNGDSRVTFENATYTQNGTAKNISVDSTISGALSLSNVGKAQTTQTAQSQSATTRHSEHSEESISTNLVDSSATKLPQNDSTASNTTQTNGLPRLATASLAMTSDSSTRFESLKFENKNLSFGADSKISVSFDLSVKKSDSNIKTDGTYYKLISTGDSGTITDNRTDKRIDFKFDNSIAESDRLFVVSKFDDAGKNLLVKFLEYDPRSFNELNKHISSKYSEILKVLTQHNPNDIAIDTAAKTDDYTLLQSSLVQIDSAMRDLANSAPLGEQILFSNNFVINTRIAQVRLTQADKIHNLRFANNDEDMLYKQISRGVASDISYDFSQNDDLHNNVWLNVGGGYFNGGNSTSVFASTNVGYDRLSKFGSADVLFGVMAGFGSNQSKFQSLHNNAKFYNMGLYAHGILGSNEMQSNLNINILQNNKAFQSSTQQGDNLSFNGLLSVYYKRVFALAPLGEFKQNIKPVALLGVGVNNIGNSIMATYKQESYNNISAEIGVGVQYTLRKDTNFYSAEILMRHNVYHSNDRVFVSLANAQSFIGYTLEHRKSSLEFNFIGSHTLTQSLYIQYGVLGLVDIGLSYGIKGDIKLGYRF